MRIALIIITILLFSGLMLPTELVGQDIFMIYVAVPVANIRSEPDRNSEIILKVSFGDKIFQTKIDGSWGDGDRLTIKTSKGVSGWIHKDLVSVHPPIMQKEEQKRIDQALNNIKLTVGGISIGFTEHEVINILGSPTSVEDEGGYKKYSYGTLTQDPRYLHDAIGIAFQDGKVVQIRQICGGSREYPKTLPYLNDCIPGSVHKAKYKKLLDGDTHYKTKGIIWDLDDQFVLVKFVEGFAVREYDPNIGYYYRNPLIKDYKIYEITLYHSSLKKR